MKVDRWLIGKRVPVDWGMGLVQEKGGRVETRNCKTRKMW